MKKNILLMTLSPLIALKRNKLVVRKCLNNAKLKRSSFLELSLQVISFLSLIINSKKGLFLIGLILNRFVTENLDFEGKLQTGAKKNDFLLIKTCGQTAPRLS